MGTQSSGGAIEHGNAAIRRSPALQLQDIGTTTNNTLPLSPVIWSNRRADVLPFISSECNEPGIKARVAQSPSRLSVK
ncbi:unnamed protein product [Gadus morhua 'NCC']